MYLIGAYSGDVCKCDSCVIRERDGQRSADNLLRSDGAAAVAIESKLILGREILQQVGAARIPLSKNKGICTSPADHRSRANASRHCVSATTGNHAVVAGTSEVRIIAGGAGAEVMAA